MLRMRLSLSLAVSLLRSLPRSQAPSFANHAAASATITVTAGKPKELSFTLSTKKISAGTTIFKITNKGKLAHTFKVCTKASGNCEGQLVHRCLDQVDQARRLSDAERQALDEGRLRIPLDGPRPGGLGHEGHADGEGRSGLDADPDPDHHHDDSRPVRRGSCASPQSTTVSAQLGEKGIILSPTRSIAARSRSTRATAAPSSTTSTS